MKNVLRIMRRPVVLAAVLALAVAAGAGGFLAQRAATAAAPLEGSRVSAADVRALVSAAAACPLLTPARLAGQVMIASRFGDEPARDGTIGVAGLTTEQWRAYAPAPDANPADRAASITALAHGMCQLAGQSRALRLDVDAWQLALAAHHLGMDRVVAAGAVPDDAREYVETVQRYAAWYALQPVFGGTPPAAPAPDPGTVIPVPEAHLTSITEAGKQCAAMPANRIAAQLMVTSGFDAYKLGPAGEQGIAQFLPQVWKTYAKADPKHTPWQPEAAIPALGRAMCALTTRSGGQYGPALAAFTRGDARGATPLAEAVAKAEAEYAKDTRLGKPAPSPSASPSATASAPPPAAPKPSRSTQAAAPERTNQPPLRSPAGGRSYGPYFIVNLATTMCADLYGAGPGTSEDPVGQYPCLKAGDDNQEWSLVPHGTGPGGEQLYLIQNIDDDLCLDVPGTGAVPDGTEITETYCYEVDNQEYRLEPKIVSGGWQYYWIRNAASGQCLDAYGVGGGPAPLTLMRCTPGDDHEWALVQKSEW